MRAYFITALAALIALVFSFHAAQAQRPTDKGPFSQRLIRPQVSYVIQGRVRLDSGLVHASMDIDYRNQTKSEISELFLANRSAGLHGKVVGSIDSILMDGAPIQKVRNDSSKLLQLPLSRVLHPGESVHLILSFTSPIPVKHNHQSGQAVCNLTEWHPNIPSNGEVWVRLYDRWGVAPSIAEPADYAVSLTLDSEWMAAANGELLNEREIFGVLPRERDTIVIDALHHPEHEGGTTLGPEPSKNGQRTWIWRAENAGGFPVVIGKDWDLDRVVSDGVVVDLYSPTGRDTRSRLSAALEIQRLVSTLDSLTDFRPFVQTALVDDVDVGLDQVPWGNVTTQDWFSECRNRQASLALELALRWCRPILSQSNAMVTPIWFGLCNYLAISALHRIEQLRAYDGYSAFADDELSEIGDAFAPRLRRPYGFFSNIRQPKLYSPLDSVLFREWYTVPAELELLNHQLGDSLFWARLRQILQPSETGYRMEKDVRDSLAGTSEGTGWLTDHKFDLSQIDWRLDKVTARSSDSSVRVSGDIVSKSKLQIPLTIAYLFSSTDTVFQVILADSQNPDGRTHFSIELRRSPRVVILDPHYDYPDAHRYNNYHFFELGSGFREPISQVFPGYRRLRLGP